MKCFIASAFGHDDVDAVYERGITPILKRLSIQPLRVDRVEHNEDIDKKIFELLDAADFAIVDLTYARPSVYYEAGYAAGKGKPVIYIVRSDHFTARDSDLDGLRRVHFDLQMKNIIPWTDANVAFAKRLETRLRYVLKPLFLKNETRDKLEAERSEFNQLSLNAKLTLLRNKAVSLLLRQSFREFTPRGDTLNSNGFVYKDLPKRSREVGIFCMSSAFKSFFENIKYRDPLGFTFPSKDIPTENHYIVVSIRPVPRSRIVDSLSYFQPLSKGTYHSSYQSSLRKIETYVHIIDDVKSVLEFADALRNVIKRNGLDKGKH
jgi:nucleoside 2-deoxyribosyltransferase